MLLFSVLNNHDPELMGCCFKKMRVCVNCEWTGTCIWTKVGGSPAQQPSLFPTGVFLNGIEVISTKEGVGGTFSALLYLLKCTHMLSIGGCLMLIKWKLICFCVHLAVYMCVMRVRAGETDRFGQVGLAGEQTFAPGCYATFWYNGLCGTDMIFLFSPLSIHRSLKLSLSACNVFRAFIISLPQILPSYDCVILKNMRVERQMCAEQKQLYQIRQIGGSILSG